MLLSTQLIYIDQMSLTGRLSSRPPKTAFSSSKLCPKLVHFREDQDTSARTQELSVGTKGKAQPISNPSLKAL